MPEFSNGNHHDSESSEGQWGDFGIGNEAKRSLRAELVESIKVAGSQFFSTESLANDRSRASLLDASLEHEKRCKEYVRSLIKAGGWGEPVYPDAVLNGVGEFFGYKELTTVFDLRLSTQDKSLVLIWDLQGMLPKINKEDRGGPQLRFDPFVVESGAALLRMATSVQSGLVVDQLILHPREFSSQVDLFLHESEEVRNNCMLCAHVKSTAACRGENTAAFRSFGTELVKRNQHLAIVAVESDSGFWTASFSLSPWCALSTCLEAA